MAPVTYLDTHVAAWLYSGDADRLSSRARRAVEAGELLISPAVVLEFQYLFELNRIADAGRMIADDLRSRLSIRLCDLAFADVVRRSLDFSWTRDPFDRLIVAQAAQRNAMLVTKDRAIRRRYKQSVW
jgi:PIN domain nuclease of toxin-antitoxin system